MTLEIPSIFFQLSKKDKQADTVRRRPMAPITKFCCLGLLFRLFTIYPIDCTLNVNIRWMLRENRLLIYIWSDFREQDTDGQTYVGRYTHLHSRTSRICCLCRLQSFQTGNTYINEQNLEHIRRCCFRSLDRSIFEYVCVCFFISKCNYLFCKINCW